MSPRHPGDRVRRPAAARRSRRGPVALLALLIALYGGLAAADDGHRDGGAALLPEYRDECSGCHVAYPPRLLAAQSWRRIVGNLSRHYGTDASLDPATRDRIAQWLERGAGEGRRARVAPPEDRITRSAWFLKEHRDALSDRAAPASGPQPLGNLPRSAPGGAPPAPGGGGERLRAADRRLSDCAACHIFANEGDFHERNIRIPR